MTEQEIIKAIKNCCNYSEFKKRYSIMYSSKTDLEAVFNKETNKFDLYAKDELIIEDFLLECDLKKLLNIVTRKNNNIKLYLKFTLAENVFLEFGKEKLIECFNQEKVQKNYTKMFLNKKKDEKFGLENRKYKIIFIDYNIYGIDYEIEAKGIENIKFTLFLITDRNYSNGYGDYFADSESLKELQKLIEDSNKINDFKIILE